MSGADPVVDVKDVWRSFGEKHVLRGVDLAVGAGDFAAITGRSGSGKSTLFKLIAGLDHPTRGDVRVAGQDLGRASDDEASTLRLRSIGLVFQSFNLLPDLTILRNVALPVALAGAARPEANERATELLKLLGVAPLAHQRPHQISGGESQRVAIARALANRPALLLADEPTSNLDTENALNVVEALEDVNRKLGTTVLIVSHDDLVTARVRERYALHEGKLSREGAPTKSDPSVRRVQ